MAMPLLPEILLAIAGMVFLMVGVFKGDRMAKPLCYAVAVALAAAFFIGLSTPSGLAFGGLFVSDKLATFAKALIVIGAATTAVMAAGRAAPADGSGPMRFEQPVLMLFASLGMMLVGSANDLISLYVGLELQSLSLYVLAAIRRDSLRATEAGLKYFVLGALSSGMLLYGAGLIYGYTGATGFDMIAERVHDMGHPSLGLVVGIVFLLAGLAFKVSAAPFHMWTPDVYEGADTPITAFFAAAPKAAALALFARVMTEPLGDAASAWGQIVAMIAGLSVVIGAFGALTQRNIKRLMAYSSIGHVGFALIGLAAASETGVRGLLIYSAIYLFMNLAAFACILSMQRDGHPVENIDDLAGASRTHPFMAAALTVVLFSMAGIPPLAGFFGKLYVLTAAVESGLFVLAVVGVLASVVSCFYYIRLIKIMYFDEATDAMDGPMPRDLGVVLAVAAAVILLFIVVPSPIVSTATAAAQDLFQR
ncbi:MAG: NADH-quinone oxidoreductase subunit NuoN [Alphaproteobacteria bacterium]